MKKTVKAKKKKTQKNPRTETIMLTDEQVKLLQPLFDYAGMQSMNGNAGVILAQPKQVEFLGNIWSNEFRCAFVEKKYADKMIKLSIKAQTLMAKK